MPIYSFSCGKCGHREDVLQSAKAPSTKNCPNCQAPEFKKELSAPSFHLKGSGWYSTDFKNK